MKQQLSKNGIHRNVSRRDIEIVGSLRNNIKR
jgi:hypothetical protein